MLRHPPHPLSHPVFAPLILLAVLSLAPPRIRSGLRLITLGGGASARGRPEPGPLPLAGGPLASVSALGASRPVGRCASRLLGLGAELRSAPRVRLACLWVTFVSHMVRPEPPRAQRAEENQRNDASPDRPRQQRSGAVQHREGHGDRQRARRGRSLRPDAWRGVRVRQLLRGPGEDLRRAPAQPTPHRHLAAAQAGRMGTDHGSKRFQLSVVTQAVQFIRGRPDDRNEQCPISDGWQDFG
jgi:hypothetical protein